MTRENANLKGPAKLFWMKSFSQVNFSDNESYSQLRSQGCGIT